MKNVYAVILAGGKGERLWPLSRSHCPKQTLEIKPGCSLIQQAINRIADLIPKEKRYIVTTRDQEHIIAQAITKHSAHILSEPCSKNTAPAMLYALTHITQLDPEAVVIFLAADHAIGQEDAFQDALSQAANWALHNNGICLFGVRPTIPATGYGYIEYKESDQAVCLVKQFHEKPNKQTAQLYLSLPNMLWNMSMFCAKAQFFMQQFHAYAPSLVQDMNTYLKTQNDQIYHQLENISFDYAVLEKSNAVHVLPLSITWSDVGNLHEFLKMKQSFCKDKRLEIDAHNNFIHTQNHKLIVLVGVDDCCIVEMDDVLMIVKNNEVERVKYIVGQLKSTDVDYV